MELDGGRGSFKEGEFEIPEVMDGIGEGSQRTALADKAGNSPYGGDGYGLGAGESPMLKTALGALTCSGP
jgi:hypothetical protein